jgi:hypothetical protein
MVLEQQITISHHYDDFPVLNNFNKVIQATDVESHGLKQAVHEALAVVVHGRINYVVAIFKEVSVNAVLDCHFDYYWFIVTTLPVNLNQPFFVLAGQHLYYLLDVYISAN